jgi:hypothetical protein
MSTPNERRRGPAKARTILADDLMAGDALAYCLRHPSMVDPKEVLDATRDWQDARNHV